MRHTYIFVLCALSASLLMPASAEAQWQRGDWDSEEARERWRERMEQSDEGDDIDEDEIERWRSENRRVNSAIDDLDDDEVEDLPIPILFGVALDDITENFGDPRDGGSRSHEGLDIMAAEGTPIVSPTEAVVIRTGNGSGSGKYVTTANPGGETFVYMHLDDIADIDAGDELEVGDVIGYVGNTGNASGGAAHLHFEIRKNRKATDPYERITKVFTLKKKMEYLEGVLKDADDEDELAELLVEEYLGTFIQARAQGIDLPEIIEDEMPASASGSALPTRNLTVGDSGSDVMTLQSVLIAEGYLDIEAPTGTFGPLTQTALIAYQKANGITPANGQYGPLTRAEMSGSSNISEEELKEQLLAKIAELTKLLNELKAAQGR